MKEWVLLTGASSGIGKELAYMLAEDGYSLILTARRKDRLEELAKSIKGQVEVMPADLSQSQSVHQLWKSIEEKKIDIDVLVNNAGFGLVGKSTEIDLKSQEDMIELNMRAVTVLSILASQRMQKRNRGRIINIASTAAFQPIPFMAVYGASKSYVLNFSQALDNEVSEHGVRVSALCPGPVATEFFQVAGVTNPKDSISSKKVAQEAFNLLQKMKPIRIIGLKNQFMIQSARMAPRSQVTGVSRNIMLKMLKSSS